MSHIKIPQTNGPVHDLIKSRWSPRSFSGAAMPQADLETIFEAATWAFSAFNEQPWRYIYAHRGTALFDQLHSFLMPGNQPWTKNASVLILSIAQVVSANGQANPYAGHDLGAANATLMLQALSMGIYGHVMAGFDKAKAKSELGLDENLDPVAVIALGYRDEAHKLDEPFLTRENTPRSRKGLDEILLKGE
jgi:nitroreductase